LQSDVVMVTRGKPHGPSPPAWGEGPGPVGCRAVYGAGGNGAARLRAPDWNHQLQPLPAPQPLLPGTTVWPPGTAVCLYTLRGGWVRANAGTRQNGGEYGADVPCVDGSSRNIPPPRGKPGPYGRSAPRPKGVGGCGGRAGAVPGPRDGRRRGCHERLWLQPPGSGRTGCLLRRACARLE